MAQKLVTSFELVTFIYGLAHSLSVLKPIKQLFDHYVAKHIRNGLFNTVFRVQIQYVSV